MASKTWKESGEGAFPLRASEYGGHSSQFGMSLRDYLAAKAMQAAMSEAALDALAEVCETAEEMAAEIAKAAYMQADAMLAAREVAQ